MLHLLKRYAAIAIVSSLLFGCSGSDTNTSAKLTLRTGPALTDEALSGMYMSRISDDAASEKFVACLDNFVLKFDEDKEVSNIFAAISNETDTPIQEGNIAYFTEQKAPERYKRLVDQMIEIDSQTENDIFNFDSASTCVLHPEDCTLPAEEANTVRLYWTTIEHGSMGCYE